MKQKRPAKGRFGGEIISFVWDSCFAICVEMTNMSLEFKYESRIVTVITIVFLELLEERDFCYFTVQKYVLNICEVTAKIFREDM